MNHQLKINIRLPQFMPYTDICVLGNRWPLYSRSCIMQNYNVVIEALNWTTILVRYIYIYIIGLLHEYW